LLGKAPITKTYDGTEFALYYYTEGFGWTRDTPMEHMSDQILADYAARGITPENMVFTKEERDADPCTFGGEPSDTWVSLTG
jgi:hypothetical protein